MIEGWTRNGRSRRKNEKHEIELSLNRLISKLMVNIFAL